MKSTFSVGDFMKPEYKSGFFGEKLTSGLSCAPSIKCKLDFKDGIKIEYRTCQFLNVFTCLNDILDVLG